MNGDRERFRPDSSIAADADGTESSDGLTDESRNVRRAGDVGGRIVRTVRPGEELPTDRLPSARRRVDAEYTRTTEKRAAFEAFHADVAAIEPTPVRGTPVGAGGVSVLGTSSNAGSRPVRRAFVDHVEPYSGDALDDPETVHEAIATELCAEVAVSLATATDADGVSPQLKHVVLSESDRRLDELSVMRCALDGERDSLAAVDAALDAPRAWLSARRDVSLFDRSFETLASWHETLTAHCAALDDAAERRQRHLRGATGGREVIGVPHRPLAEYLYADRPVDYPALRVLAELAAACRSAQRAIRSHLVRRV